jgi:uncharacterized protein (TIGR03067 family)
MTFARFAAAVALLAVAGLVGGQEPDSPAPPGPKAARSADAQTPRANESPSELSGEWAVTRIETNGEATYDAGTADASTPPPTFAFSGPRAAVRGVQVLFVRDFAYALDPTTNPKQIDVTFADGPKKGESFAGIYALRGDELRICLRLQGTHLGRPRGFATNSGTTLYTFVLTRTAPAARIDRPAAEPPFDAILRAGNKLYFALDRPRGEEFRAGLAAFAERVELAARTADGVKDKDLVVVFFKRDGGAPAGGWTGFGRGRLREIAAAPAEQRADKLLEHAWTTGRLPKDAVPVPPAPPPKAEVPVPHVGPVPADKADAPPTAAGLPSPDRYHAYWLHPHPPGPNCEGCYPTLLLARMPIADLQKMAFLIPDAAGRSPDKQVPLLDGVALTVTTYKKDSIWNSDGVPFKPLRSFGFLRPAERDVKVDGKTYRYEDASIADVVRLLERPEGTQSISRSLPPLAGAEQTARALRFLLREQLRADAAKK